MLQNFIKLHFQITNKKEGSLSKQFAKDYSENNFVRMNNAATGKIVHLD